MPPKFFPAMDIGEVHLRHREVHGRNGVPQGIAVMRQGPGVDHRPVSHTDLAVQVVDNGSLVVALKKLEFIPLSFHLEL